MEDSVTFLRKSDVRLPNNGVKTLEISLRNCPEIITDVVEAIKQPIIIKEVIFSANGETLSENCRLVIGAIEEHNKTLPKTPIDKLTIDLQLEVKEGPLSNLSNLPCSVKIYQIAISFTKSAYRIFKQLAMTVMPSGTNFNHFSFKYASHWPTELAIEGFGEFCNYFSQNSTTIISSLQLDNFIYSQGAMKCLIELIKKTKTLTDLEFQYCLHESIPILCDAIASSNVRRLKAAFYGPAMAQDLIQSRPFNTLLMKLEELSVLTEDMRLLDTTTLFKAVEDTQSLQVLEIPRSYFTPDDLWFLERNQSLVKFTMFKTTSETCARSLKKISEITQRNRQLQNSRVHMMVTLLYNMARHHHDNNDTSSSSSVTSSVWCHLPRDVWTIIVSFVIFPGVTSLDFGKVARSIFNDQSIRRVI
jgi:hypothetical protein